MTNFDPVAGQTFTPANSPYGKSLIRSDKNNFAPRLGIAYQLTPNTVLRTGYGRFFMLFERAGSEDQLALNLPFFVNNVVGATSASQTANDMRVRTGFNLSLNPSAVNPVTVLVRAVNPEAVIPSVDQWNFGVQRLLPGDWVVTLDYVGTKGTHLSALRNLNQQLFTSNGTGTGIIPYPTFGPIEFRDNGGNSIYHGGEATVEKRFSRGFSIHSAYTYSKSIDYAQEHLFSGGSSSFMQNARNLREQRGRSDFDYRHRWVTSYIYEVPFGKGKVVSDRRATVPPSGRMADQRCDQPSLRTAVDDLCGGEQQPGRQPWRFSQRLGGLCQRRCACQQMNAIVDRWFDASGYSVPTPARLGNCGRNTLDGPGLVNFDFALAKKL